jgi:hypothetical protein
MRRLALLAILFAAAARAADDAPDAGEARAVSREVGESEWRTLPHWRQRMLLRRYQEFLALPVERREAVLRGEGLRGFLLAEAPPAPPEDPPEDLREALARFPEEVRPLAARLVQLRRRQLQLDQALFRLPAGERRATFERLFPEPFDPAAARAAHEALRARLKETLAWELLRDVRDEEARRGRELSEEERREVAAALYRRAAEAEERAVAERIRRELLRAGGREPRRAREALERAGFLLLEGPRIFLTPRERELVRYAAEPFDCPFVDLGFLGPAPEDPEARRAWEADYRALARAEILSCMRLPREMLLHLVDSGSPEDLLRALRGLRGERSRKGGGDRGEAGSGR